MRVISEPSVEVVAVTVFMGHSRYQIPEDGDDSVQLGSFAAKGCYDSFGEQGRSNQENQAGIIESRHGSVLEHFNITLFIEGITRACSHEIVRHRAGFGYSQRSTRYTNEGDSSIVLDPYYASLREDDELLVEHINSCSESVVNYENQVRELITRNPLSKSGTDLRKWARGKARNLLPHALETRMTMTGNIRAWRHFLEMRTERFAEAEIRRLAALIFFRLKPHIPFYLSDYGVDLVDGIPALNTPYRKV